jgi:hypothetical protein
MPAVIESTIDLTDPVTRYTVRIWCDETERPLTTPEGMEVLQGARKALDRLATHPNATQELAQSMAKLAGGRVSAIQFLRPAIPHGDYQGARLGIVYYTSWP